MRPNPPPSGSEITRSSKAFISWIETRKLAATMAVDAVGHSSLMGEDERDGLGGARVLRRSTSLEPP